MVKKKIAQIGTFDVENYGDLLFPLVLKNNLSDYDIDVFSPIGGGDFLPDKEQVFPIKDLEKKHLKNKYDAIVIGGGDLLRLDSFVAKSYFGKVNAALELWVRPIFIGKKYDIPVIFNCIGVPYHFKNREKEIIRILLEDVDYLVVRDDESKRILEECGLTNVRVCPDSVLCISEIKKQNELLKIKNKLEEDKKIPMLNNYIVIQHSKRNDVNSIYIEKLRELMHLIIDEYKYNIVLLPIGYVHDDIDFIEKLCIDDSNVKFIKNKLTPIEMLSVISNSCGYVGTSMHGAVTAYAYDKPILLINNEGLFKRTGLLKNINKSDVEIRNILEISEIFKEKFFKGVNEKDKNKVEEQISNHFDNIKNIINNGHKNTNSISDLDMFLSIFDLFSTIPEEENKDEMRVYFDFGLGFSEEQSKSVLVSKDDKEISFKIIIPKNVKKIRIDPFEGLIVSYRNLKIISNNRTLDYIVTNQISIDDTNYIFSTDPNIYVDIDSSVGEIEFYMDLKVVSESEALELGKQWYENLVNKNKELDCYKKMYENTFDYKLGKVMDRIRNKDYH